MTRLPPFTHSWGHYPGEIEILYQNTRVDRLTKTTVVFWNAGTETIDGNDIVESDPIRFSFSEDEEILSAKVVASTRDVNESSITIEQETANAALLDFRFLDSGDGVRIEFLHTDTKRYPTVNGTVKGVPQGIIDAGRSLEGVGEPALKMFMSTIFGREKVVMYIALGIGLVVSTAGVLPDVIYEYFGIGAPGQDDKPSGLSERLTMIIIGMLYAALAGFVLWTGRRRYPKALVE